MNPIREFLRPGRALAAPLMAAFLLIALPACAQSHGDAEGDMGGEMEMSDGNEVVATVAGDDISMAELESESEDALKQVELAMLQCERQAKQGRFDALNAQLQNLVRERLLAAEAEEAGQSVDDYRAAELESRIAEVTDADVEAFFNENKARIGNRTLEQISGQIRQYLENQRRAEAENAFYGELESKYDVAYLLEPPRAEVEAVGPAKGPENAPVTIVEFSDFECPFCSRVLPTLEQVEANYGDKVRIVFRQFPLNIHPNAQKAAEASLCAEDQGKFWEMHDHMFANQRQLSVDNLKAAAGELGLDVDTFAQCLDSGEHAGVVEADMKAGVEAGVSGTPAMFINGQLVSGAVPYEQVAEVIDAELKRKGMDGGSTAAAE
jgi:protein-disulfide isomerase